MSDTLFCILLTLAFLLGWLIRGMKAMRDEQGVTHEMFRRAADLDASAILKADNDAWFELGKSHAYVESAALVAGIEATESHPRQPQQPTSEGTHSMNK